MSLYRKLLLRLHPFRSLPDDYITRMRSAIGGAGMLHDGNVYAFDYVLQRLPLEGAVLEIGSFAGLSTNVIAWLMKKHQIQRPFFSCDPWLYDGYYDQIRQQDTVYMTHFEGCNHITRGAFTDFIRDSFIRNTQFFSEANKPHTLHLTSDHFFEAWKGNQIQADVFNRPARLGGPLSFVYVDGNHAYDVARRDVENSLEFLKSGGFILLDDSADYWKYGSVQLAKEMKQWKGLELVMKNPNYLFRKK